MVVVGKKADIEPTGFWANEANGSIFFEDPNFNDSLTSSFFLVITSVVFSSLSGELSAGDIGS